MTVTTQVNAAIQSVKDSGAEGSFGGRVALIILNQYLIEASSQGHRPRNGIDLARFRNAVVSGKRRLSVLEQTREDAIHLATNLARNSLLSVMNTRS